MVKPIFSFYKLTKLNLNDIKFLISYFLPIILFLLLLFHGDIESNSGPKKKEQTYFLLCHWNVNSLVAHKIPLLVAYNSVYKYDICITVILGDFNALSKSWWSGDSTTIECTRLD